MSPLHWAVDVKVRLVSTIGSGSGMTIGAWSWKPPSCAVLLTTGTACELLVGAAAAGPAKSIAASPVKHAATRAARNFVRYHIGATSFRLDRVQPKTMDARDDHHQGRRRLTLGGFPPRVRRPPREEAAAGWTGRATPLP